MNQKTLYYKPRRSVGGSKPIRRRIRIKRCTFYQFWIAVNTLQSFSCVRIDGFNKDRLFRVSVDEKTNKV